MLTFFIQSRHEKLIMMQKVRAFVVQVNKTCINTYLAQIKLATRKVIMTASLLDVHRKAKTGWQAHMLRRWTSSQGVFPVKIQV